jgi:hypothetical protein
MVFAFRHPDFVRSSKTCGFIRFLIAYGEPHEIAALIWLIPDQRIEKRLVVSGRLTIGPQG